MLHLCILEMGNLTCLCEILGELVHRCWCWLGGQGGARLALFGDDANKERMALNGALGRQGNSMFKATGSRMQPMQGKDGGRLVWLQITVSAETISKTTSSSLTGVVAQVISNYDKALGGP